MVSHVTYKNSVQGHTSEITSAFKYSTFLLNIYSYSYLSYKVYPRGSASLTFVHLQQGQVVNLGRSLSILVDTVVVIVYKQLHTQ